MPSICACFDMGPGRLSEENLRVWTSRLDAEGEVGGGAAERSILGRGESEVVPNEDSLTLRANLVPLKMLPPPVRSRLRPGSAALVGV
jgi:hypothetical protein